MIEHELYQKFKVSWVFYLMDKYLGAEVRFAEILRLTKSALAQEELEAAREMWKKEKKK